LVVLIGTASTRVMVNLSSSFGATTSRLNSFTRISQAKTLMRYYDAEKAGLVKCVEY